MPAPHEKSFKVFYSWQSDLPDAVNLKLIRNALNQAANLINAEHDLNLHVVIDEATREVPGSPNIADSIFAKIREADVFVCDLTKVAEVPNEAGDVRKYCNPNAALELGYAVHVLGWNRIIIVFNEGYGVVPDDLPFDTRGHRTSVYRCKAELDKKRKPTTACQSQINSSTGNLRMTFVKALKLIAKDDQKRPQELEAKDPEAIRHERDVEQLKKLFYWLHLGVLDEFIDRLGFSCLTSVGVEFFECFSAVIESARFHVDDGELRQRIETFFNAWKDCFRYSHSMDLRSNGAEAFFSMSGVTPRPRELMKQSSHTAAHATPLRAALDSLLGYVRAKYL